MATSSHEAATMRRPRTILAALALSLIAAALPAEAQTLGAFTWQTQPY